MTEVEFGVGAVDNGVTAFFADVAVFDAQFHAANVTVQLLHVCRPPPYKQEAKLSLG